MTVSIGRRELLAALGGAAAAWPLAASAQQTAMPVIGFLRSTTSTGSAHIVSAFRHSLSEAGFVEGQNVAVEYRWADDQRDRLPGLVADLVRRQVAVIVANTTAAQAAKAEATTTPIVFVSGSDPVGAGLVASLNRPGSNITGVVFTTADLATKRLGLLHELVPKAAVIAVLLDPNAPGTPTELRGVEKAQRAISPQVVVVKAAREGEFNSAFATILQAGAGALHAARRRGGYVAARGPRAADGQGLSHRHAGDHICGTERRQSRRISTRSAATWLRRGPQLNHRISLGRGPRRALPGISA
jgi:putative ABC transport system substrate-binding protein